MPQLGDIWEYFGNHYLLVQEIGGAGEVFFNVMCLETGRVVTSSLSAETIAEWRKVS